MAEGARQTKITFADMRDMGVRGLLIYCSDYKCSHSTAISGDDGLMMFSCPIWKHGSFAKLVASEAPMFGRTSTGTLQLEQGAGRDDGLSLTRCPNVTSQACSAAVSVLNGEPTTFTADLFL